MDYIKSFESHLREEGKAEKTIQSYTGDTMGFLTYLKSKELSFDGVLGRFTINSYKNYLIKENYEPTTINKKLNSLQSFNDFLIHEGVMTEKVVEPLTKQHYDKKRRVKRGLFRTNEGHLVNSDINGYLNISRRYLKDNVVPMPIRRFMKTIYLLDTKKYPQ